MRAIRTVLAAYRGHDTHITQKQIEAAWTEYEVMTALLGTYEKLDALPITGDLNDQRALLRHDVERFRAALTNPAKAQVSG